MIASTYRVLQHLSIDIVFGAVILLHFFSKAYGVSPDWTTYILLGISIWLIYTADHLRDAKSATSGRRERYFFHKKHERQLKIGMIIMVLIALICLIYTPLQILISGAILVIFCFAYILFQAKLARFGLKELYIAIIYTLGIQMVPIVFSQFVDWYLFSSLLILTFLNLIIFSWFEKDEDEVDSFTSIATKYGKSKVAKAILVILSIGFSLSISGVGQNAVYASYFIIVSAIFVILLFKESWAKQKSRYRTIGDAVFLLPILYEFL